MMKVILPAWQHHPREGGGGGEGEGGGESKSRRPEGSKEANKGGDNGREEVKVTAVRRRGGEW